MGAWGTSKMKPSNGKVTGKGMKEPDGWKKC